MTTETATRDVCDEDVRAMLAIFASSPCPHCRGTGEKRGRDIPETWVSVLARLYVVNKPRIQNSTKRDMDGFAELYGAYDDIRRLVAEARTVGIPVGVAAEAMQLSTSQLYNILKKATGESTGVRSGRGAG